MARSEAEKAKSFAKQYVVLVDALVKEGVAPKNARDEAFRASMTLLMHEDAEKRVCSVCGTPVT